MLVSQGFFSWLHGFNTQTISRLLYLASWLQGLFTWLHGFNTQKISLFHYHIIIITDTSLSLLPQQHHHCHFDINDNIFSTSSVGTHQMQKVSSEGTHWMWNKFNFTSNMYLHLTLLVII
jgi:hypothetical protein